MHDLSTMLNHIPGAVLVIVRIGGLMVFAPIFASSVIPMRIRAFLSLVVGLAAYPVLCAGTSFPHDLKLELWTLAPIIAMEALIGLTIGFVANLPLHALTGGGLIMGQQMGLGFGQLFNPAIDDEADVIGQMLFFMGIIGFLMIGGHELLMLSVLHSFERIPLGSFAAGQGVVALITGLMWSSLELALRVSAPLLAIVFLETVAMGLLSKTVPQLNILSLGFPIRILVGMATIALGLVVINDVSIVAMEEMFEALSQWMEAATIHG